jgi:hypothetical protein
MEGLQNCLRCLRDWLNVFFSLGEIMLVDLPAAAFIQLDHVSHSLFHLTSLEDPFWDRDAVMKTVNAFDVMEQVIQMLQNIPGLTGRKEDDPDDSVNKAIEGIRSQKQGWMMKMSQLAASSGAGHQQAVPVDRSQEQGAYWGDDLMPNTGPDEQWLRDFLVSWDFGVPGSAI